MIQCQDDLDLTHRTVGEELWLWRRRTQPLDRRVFGKIGAALSQREAAEVLGISERTIDDLENERPVDLDVAAALEVALCASAPSAGDLCRLARRRSGLSLDEVAAGVSYRRVFTQRTRGAGTWERTIDQYGVSKVTLHRMERSGDPALVAYWVGRRYRFGAARALGEATAGVAPAAVG